MSQWFHVLVSRSSRLIADKSSHGFLYPCDEPGRGDLPSHLSQHDVVIDHLTWVDTFLGAHSVGTLIHNDSMEALSRHHHTYHDTSLQMRPMLLNPLTAVFVSNGDILSTLGAADLLVFHIESFKVSCLWLCCQCTLCPQPCCQVDTQF